MMFYENFRKFTATKSDIIKIIRKLINHSSPVCKFDSFAFIGPFLVCAWAKTSRTRATPTGRGTAMACELRTEQSLSMIWQKDIEGNDEMT